MKAGKVTSILVLIWFGYNANAQLPVDALLDLTIEELLNVEVITASQTTQKISDAPATIYVVTDEQIRDRGYTSLIELLEDIPEIEIQHKSASEYSSYYSFRGISGNEKFMLLLNGIRINSMAGTPHAVANNYSVANADRVEVILGPASALYGVDAFCGIVNIITKSGEEIKGADVNLSYGSFNSTDNSVTLGYGNKNISFNLTGSVYYSDEPFFPDIYTDDFSWYNNVYKEDGSMRLGPFDPDVIVATGEPQAYSTPTTAYFINGGLNVKNFEFGYFRNYDSHNSSMGMRPDYNIYSEQAQFNTQLASFYAKHLFTSLDNKWIISSNFSRGSYELTPESLFQNTFTNYASGYKYAEHTSFQIREQITYSIRKGHSIIGGFSFQDISALAKTGDLPFAFDKDKPVSLQNIYYIGTNVSDVNGEDLTLMQDFHYVKQKNYGSFVQYQMQLAKLIGLTTGLRYDYNTRYGSSINPRVGAVFSFSDKLKLKVLYGEAFLAPSVYKAFQHYGAFLTVPDSNDPTQVGGLYGQFWHLSNPDLKPEKLRTIETALSHIVGDFGIGLDGYYNVISDLIVTDLEFGQEFKGIPVDAVERPLNRGRATTYGATARIDTYHNWKNLILNGYLVYSFSDGDIDGTVLPFSARNTVKFGAVLKSDRFSFNIRTLVRSTTAHPNITDANGSRERNDSFVLVNLFARYQLSEFIALNIKVRNLLNSKYYNVSFAQDEGFAATPQDPIKIMAGLNFSLKGGK